MIFKRASRAEAEKVFIVVQNVYAGTLTAGYSCCFELGTNSDGVRVTQPATANLAAFAGVADSDIAQNAYGLVQVYGFRTSTYVNSSAGTTTAGMIGVPTNAQFYQTLAASSTTSRAFAVLAKDIAASSSSAYLTMASCFIKAL